MGSLSVITEPTVEPITLAEAKAALGIDHTDDDDRITGYIKASRIFAEKYCRLKIPSQVVERTYDRWPSAEINLDVWPLQSIDSVKYDDTASPIAEQTLVLDTDYYSDIVLEGGRVRALTGWPSVAVKPSAIRIRMTAGYADSGASPIDLADNIPESIKNGIKAYVVYLYEQNCDMLDVAQDILRGERRYI